MDRVRIAERGKGNFLPDQIFKKKNCRDFPVKHLFFINSGAASVQLSGWRFPHKMRRVRVPGGKEKIFRAGVLPLSMVVDWSSATVPRPMVIAPAPNGIAINSLSLPVLLTYVKNIHDRYGD